MKIDDDGRLFAHGVFNEFCSLVADDFFHVYDRFVKINGLAPKRDKSKRKYYRDCTMSDSEVITIMILFHLCG